MYLGHQPVAESVRRSTLQALVLALTLASIANATGLPPIDRVAFTPGAGALLPADARFLDENAQRVRLGDYWRARVAIVVPAYYGCSNLCTMVLHTLAQALLHSGLRAGRDVEVVVVSINPLDTPQVARAKKHDVLPDGARTGWHFLTGEAASIDAITTALDYHYVYDAEQQQYAHAAGAAVVSREGRVSRTLAGVAFSPASLRGALRAAGDSTIGESKAVATQAASADDNRAVPGGGWLLCYHYDPHTGRYTFVAMNAVRLVAIVVLAALAAYVVRSRRAERRAARGS
jgi:protein SCO1/2